MNAVMTGAGVQSVARLGERFQVRPQDNRLLEADALLFATPTHVTAKVLKNFDPAAGGKTQMRFAMLPRLRSHWHLNEPIFRIAWMARGLLCRSRRTGK